MISLSLDRYALLSCRVTIKNRKEEQNIVGKWTTFDTLKVFYLIAKNNSTPDRIKSDELRVKQMFFFFFFTMTKTFRLSQCFTIHDIFFCLFLSGALTNKADGFTCIHLIPSIPVQPRDYITIFNNSNPR